MNDFVTIGPIDYRIVTVAGESFQDGDGHDLLGELDVVAGEIRISGDLHGPQREVAIVHEIVHAILVNAGQGHDEQAVTALGYGLAKLNRENPYFWEGFLK